LILFVFLDTMVAAVAADASADEVTGALVGFEKFLVDAISYTGSVVGAGFTSLSVSFIYLYWTAGTAAATDAVAGAVADAMAVVLVGTKMSSDGVVLDTGGVIGANFTSLLVSFVFSGGIVPASDAVTGALVAGVVSSDGIFLSEASTYMSSDDAVSKFA
jgi:hypothetical protein